ncbi:MAG: hypothetical protein WAR01_03770 [Dokdonella sp.]|uniref:hypothetical protein n=1 Tax=Dokdonella sp. TaxID=2291710 RepID=UPI003BB0E69B
MQEAASAAMLSSALAMLLSALAMLLSALTNLLSALAKGTARKRASYAKPENALGRSDRWEIDEPTTYHDDPQNFGIAYMRHAVLLIVGLLSGVILSITAMRVLNARKDAYPEALMNVLKHELIVADRAATTPVCNDNANAIDKLILLSNDIITAMPDAGTPDRVFHQYISNFHDKVVAAGQSDCAQRKQALTEVKHACDDCHRDYR